MVVSSSYDVEDPLPNAFAKQKQKNTFFLFVCCCCCCFFVCVAECLLSGANGTSDSQRLILKKL